MIAKTLLVMAFLFILGLLFIYLGYRITILEQRIDYLVEKLYSQPEEIIDVEDELDLEFSSDADLLIKEYFNSQENKDKRTSYNKIYKELNGRDK